MDDDINKNIKQDLNLKSMPTIEKILKLQKLLKDLSYRKRAFNDIKEKTLSEINKNCYIYLEGRIKTKKIFDHILNDSTKINYNKYVLIQDSQDNLKTLYEPLYNFYFLLQNNNSLMMKLIELCKERYYEELSDFFVHFLYVDIIDYSFNEDRLIMMIYLLLEKYILKSSSDIYLKDPFLIKVFKSLTRKIDIRNFLGTILNKNIIKIKNIRTVLTLNIKEVNKNLNQKSYYLFHNLYSTINPSIEKDIPTKKKLFDLNIQSKFNKFSDKAEITSYLKRTKKITISNEKKENDKIKNLEKKSTDDNFLDDYEIIDKDGRVKEIYKPTIFKKRKTDEIKEKKEEKTGEKKENKKKFLDIDELRIKEKTKSENKPLFKTLEICKTKSGSSSNSQNLNNNKDEDLVLDKLILENSVTKRKIIEILEGYKDTKKNNINIAMIEYLNNLLKIIDDEKNNKSGSTESYFENLEENKNKDEEIFSSSLIINDLISRTKNQSKDSFNKLMKNIVINHHIITVFINHIINSISRNIDNFPYLIKCIFKIIDILLYKKYSNNSSHFQNYIFKVNFLIGNIILPILKNPNFNGIISDILTDVTKKNLEIIHDIFEKMITGNLFKKTEDQSMVLYNMFIIETLPQIFEIIDNFGKNFELPDFLKRLVDSFDNNEIHEKNMNYKYFKEKPNENIQFQCLCFSFENLLIFNDIIGVNKETFIDKNNNSDEKEILKEFIKSLEEGNFTEKYMEEKEEGNIKYFYLTKITYNDIIEKILEDNSIEKLNKNKNEKDIIPVYKKCLEEVLSYENYYYLTEFKKINEKPIKNKDENDNNLKLKRKKALRSSLINALESINKEDDDFKKVIFPKIENNLIFELNSEEDNKLIIYCTNYLKFNMEKLPKEYIEHNYRLLFNELINEVKNKIELLDSNIIFEHYNKINEAEKINILSANFYSQIKNLEKLEYIEYLNKNKNFLLPYNFIIEKDNDNIITKMKYCPENEKGQIEQMIKNFPDFRSYSKEYDNILDIEEKAEVHKAIKDYFKEMKTLINKEELFEKLDEKEKEEILYDLENYILNKLYDKLYPSQPSEADLEIYEKNEKLALMKPEQLIEKHKFINESLLKEASKYIELLNIGITPQEKLDYVVKGLKIIQNLITLVKGEEKSGSDDINELFYYSVFIAKIKNFPTNLQYISMYLDINIAGIYRRLLSDLEASLALIDMLIKN